mmetsp:Transcript_8677/g.7767  ORF Transcript_8677/g.7767 Transcript_8677/m.7767 type:complete len:122 (-) Transcript_8677:1-366(-)
MKDIDGYTALMYSIIIGHINIFKQLLNHHNIDVNIQNNDGNSALILAVHYGKYDIAQMLIHNSNVDVNYGNTPFSLAVFTDCIETAKLFLTSNKNTNIYIHNTDDSLAIGNSSYYDDIIQL